MLTSAVPSRLKGRPQKVLIGIAAGYTNAEIATYLKDKVTNVQNDVQKILHALGVDRRAAAAVAAIRQGIITYGLGLDGER